MPSYCPLPTSIACPNPSGSGSPPRDAEKLSTCSKLCYGIGGIPNQIAASATAFYLQIFLLDIAHVSSFLKLERKVSFFKGHGLTMKSRPYLTFTAAFFLISAAVQVMIEQGNFVLFCTHAAGLRNHFQTLVLIILVSAVLGIPLWQKFLKHFGKKTATCGISWMIPFVIMLVTIPNLILAYVTAFVSGLSIAASMLLPWSMLPDLVDHFRVQHPHSTGHETIFYSSYVFFHKISAGIGLGISSLSLEFAGFQSGVCKQPQSVATMLKILIAAVPATLISTGLFILLFYPITEKSRKETKFALENLR
uniref:Major facilitator superfamily domain containing 2B n=1 Tax=Varanus komodoensis TaxID=61221 RepID=A0A8D2L1T5_VARKO